MKNRWTMQKWNKSLALVMLGAGLGVLGTVSLVGDRSTTEAPAPPVQTDTPKQLDFDLLLQGEPTLGRQDAPVTIVEFSDYQCPYCRLFQQNVFPELKSEFIDQGLVRFIHKDLPLPYHPQAESSAAVARCAERQNAFWAIQNALYAEQNCLSCKGPVTLGINAGLNEPQLQRCLQDPAVADTVRSNRSEAELHGIRSTPTFVIGATVDSTRHRGTIVEGALPWPEFRTLIRAELNSINPANQDE